MTKKLIIRAGACSSAGHKESNQDCHGFLQPEPLLCDTKGIVAAIADGISSSQVSHIASQTAINSFLSDYYCTSEAWSVKKSAHKVLQATNSWLFAQSQNSPHRFNKDKGYICTFSGLIFKSNTAHIFHSGDSRIYHLPADNLFNKVSLEQLTHDHRRAASASEHYLTRALGIHQQLDLDYSTVSLNRHDVFLLATDGIYEFCTENYLQEHLSQCTNANSDLNARCQEVMAQALAAGSDDNLTLQILVVEQLPEQRLDEVQQQASAFLLPPELKPRMVFEGYTIVRDIYVSSRSHVYLAKDNVDDSLVAIKVPSVELGEDSAYLENLLLEDWIAKRLDSPYILKAHNPPRKKNFLYIVSEYVAGQSLAQWMIDHPKPSLSQVRDIVTQIAKGLQRFHRQEMVHQDLRPNNIMIDESGLVKIIDFGSTKVAGIDDIKQTDTGHLIPGTVQFSAPEYFLGHAGDARSDIFSLAVISYQMLTGRLPYGLNISNARTKKAQDALRYHPIHREEVDNRLPTSVPAWCEQAIKKALSIDPRKRYEEVSEFVHDLHQPSVEFLQIHKPPLIERDPVKLWQGISFFLLILLLLHISL